jgi:tRNA pseudouridine55 synthase
VHTELLNSLLLGRGLCHNFKMSVTGLFGVCKPVNWLGTRVVTDVKKVICKQFNVKLNTIRVGHGGNLDSFATGVMVIGVGRPSTRKLQVYLEECNKRYVAKGCLGYVTPTQCPNTKPIKHASFDHVTRDMMESAIEEFVGLSDQVTPDYSMRSVNGIELYKYAMKGTIDQIQKPVKQIRVDRIELLEFEPPYFTVDVSCGSGVYIRKLIEDVGARLGTLATTVELVRTQQGNFKLGDPNVLNVEDWNWENFEKFLVPIENDPKHSPPRSIEKQQLLNSLH